MKILYTAQELAEAVARLGHALNQDFQTTTEPVVLLVVLKGALVFAADLIRQLTFPCEVECIRASSYRQSTSPGALTLENRTLPYQGRSVVVIEDIVDTGQTLHYLLAHLAGAQVRVCTLLDKPHRRREHIPIDYRGFLLTQDHFIVGYGLDYAERYRELPYIGILEF